MVKGKIERLLQRIFPAQKKAAEKAEKQSEKGSRLASKEFSSLPADLQEKLMEDATIANFFAENTTRGDERRHADL